ncbi:ABC transporter permease [Tahibacter caeni]|uniref:ABC transporter permease n=1 Tax=Tahibacter caeni TaxID=1453545 RepID=UPI002147DB44|nr:ABC transporter permease [Tahibacter caeni]
MLSTLLFDLKYAWRLFLKRAGSSFLCIVVVALSVGLALFVYVIDYNMALKPLPFTGSGDWLSLQLSENASRPQRPQVDAYTYQEITRRVDRIDYLGAFAAETAVLSEGQTSTRLRAAAISPGLLSAMHATPQLGRTFDAADANPGAPRNVLLSHTAWQTYFAGDPAVVGKQARIDGQPVQVVGVMPADFFAFRDFEIWRPLQLPALAAPGDADPVLTPIVRLKDSQGKEAAVAAIQAVVDDAGKNYQSRFGAERGVGLFPGHRMYTHGDTPVIAMATFIAIAVLFLGGVNISLIIFAMLMERTRELALRTALGSTRRSLIRQCLLQSGFVVLFGLAVGIVLAALSVDWAHGLLDFTARMQALGRSPSELVMRPLDLVAAAAIAIVLWLSSTLIPAARLSKLDPAVSLAGTGKGGLGSRSGNRMASILVGVQVIVSSLLLVICSNVVLSVNKELNRPIGVQVEQRIMSTYPTEFDGRYAQAADRLQYWDRLTEAVKQRIPGAEVAYTTADPTGPINEPAMLEDRSDVASDGSLKLPVSVVSENYFALLGIGLKAGRLFDSTDDGSAPGVVVVDQLTADHYWPGRNPIGQRLRLSPNGDSPWLTVVGVASSVAGPYSRTVGVVYRPLRQVAPAGFQLLVKLPPAAPESSREALHAAAFAVDQNLPLHNLQMLDDYLLALNSYKSLVPGFTGIGLVLLVLAATGLFGLIGRSVSQRTQEIGVRRALGSSRSGIVARFLRQASVYLVIAIVGGCLGVVMTTGMSGAIPNVLDNVALVTTGVFLTLTLVIFVSVYFPVHRAVALEPGDALRHE